MRAGPLRVFEPALVLLILAVPSHAGSDPSYRLLLHFDDAEADAPPGGAAQDILGFDVHANETYLQFSVHVRDLDIGQQRTNYAITIEGPRYQHQIDCAHGKPSPAETRQSFCISGRWEKGASAPDARGHGDAPYYDFFDDLDIVQVRFSFLEFGEEPNATVGSIGVKTAIFVGAPAAASQVRLLAADEASSGNTFRIPVTTSEAIVPLATSSSGPSNGAPQSLTVAFLAVAIAFFSRRSK